MIIYYRIETEIRHKAKKLDYFAQQRIN